MDKRYYSARHKRKSKGYSKNKEESKGSNFILRLNICIGLAIVAVGVYQLKDDFGINIRNYLEINTSVDTMKNAAADIKNFVVDVGNTGFLAVGEDFVPDDETEEYIKNLDENSYYNIQKRLESPNEAWIEPVENGTVTDVFGERVNPITGSNENHKGIDIGVGEKSEAVAVKSGVVIDEGYSESYGNWIKYRTYDNYDILYAHLSSVKAEINDEIKQGQVIAYTGNTGSSTGPHLHYEIIKDGEYINPDNFYKS